MGVLNVTPDSFSDGGRYDDPDRALEHALQLEADGADIIDIGAESTRPGSVRVPEAEELRRLVPVLKKLRDKLQTPISVDTYKSGVALKALEYGAEIINDPSGLTFDPNLAKVINNGDAGVVVNHMRGTPESWAKLGPMKDIMNTLAKDLDAAANRARHAGILKERIVIDPGLGFGKRKEQNAEIIAKLPDLARLEIPILIGPSRKMFLKQTDDEGTEFATAGAVAACVLRGAHIIRVHDVKAMRAVSDTVEAIIRTSEEY
ncbi:dihydropteroate synthase [Bryobacterales bacterium F-183]|nr:dihydropteroate synthase [Bryobacterales bacterium F-183]